MKYQQRGYRSSGFPRRKLMEMRDRSRRNPIHGIRRRRRRRRRRRIEA
jgi:hypothetical protein